MHPARRPGRRRRARRPSRASAHEGALSPLQQAFIEEDAFQCGFCTPGQLLSASALLEHTDKPSRQEIRAAMSGNLCRCGAYVKIERAILRASGQEVEV